MVKKITDDFDLEKIMLSGQAFRITKMSNGVYRFVTGQDVMYIKKVDEKTYDISCSEEKWQDTWAPYFDLGRNYASIRREAKGKSEFVDAAMEYGKGIRVLKQDPFETLISFIISQRKSIPAISSSVEKISEKYGKKTPDGVSLFPTPEALSAVPLDDLSSCGLGYRTTYVSDAAKAVVSGEIDLEKLYDLSDEELFENLMRLRGVGKKVANCVCLFAYARISMVPIDVWIERAIREECAGVSPFELYGEEAGIIQQYIFFYERGKKGK
ncbi:MAG: DNA-3-methyladenine glycosylase 2 family protein [Eubacterium sp.]|nr:DNA-3-methyladenine glycosylase 2 family protein [Eubacterium sp.]